MENVNWTPSQKDAIFSRGCSVAVSAAAGSGKTAVLTRRIIERVCAEDGSGDISRTLVVTFTKAAAAELVSRISDALANELAKKPEDRHIRAQMFLLPSAKISTINSFCLDLIRTNFQKLDIPADFSVADESEIIMMMREIMEELISDYFEGDGDTGVSDEKKIENFSVFADTFGDATRLEKLAETLISLYNTLSSTLRFLDQIRDCENEYLRAANSGFSGSVWERVIRQHLIRFLRHNKTIYEEALSYIDDDDVFKSYKGSFYEDFRFIEETLSYAESDSSYQELSAILDRYEPIRLPSVRGGSKGAMAFFKQARTDFSKEIRIIAKEYFSYGEDDLNEALLQTANVLSALSAFMESFEKRFSAEKKRRRLLTFADMERYALELLWDAKENSPTILARSLSDSLDEIYIDEYQDTNEIQDKIFSSISRGDNCFNVGDVKQSIYSFRGAEPAIFSSILQGRPKYKKDECVKAVKIFLSENFRSSAEILDFCNGVFETLMNAEETRYGIDDRLNCGSEKSTTPPEIYLIPKKEKPKDEEEEEEEDPIAEADFVAEKIAELLSNGVKADGSPVRPSDIAILLRSASTSSAVYEEALKRKGIPCRNDAITEFFESAEVLLMISLLSVIDNPDRDIYLAAILKSPIYGITLDELIYIRRFAPDVSLFQALRRFTEEKGFAKGKKFLRDHQKYAAISAETPCDNLIWQIYTETGIFSVLASNRERSLYEIEQERANLISLYNYARSFERGGFRGLSAFISFVNKMIENKEKVDISQFSASGDVVNIMTIHKSKGLEFPICFLAETAKKMNFPEMKEKTVYSHALGIAVKLSANDGLLRVDTPMRMATIIDMRRRAVDEELRVLYVALTRAKERLIITGSVASSKIEEGKFDLFSQNNDYSLKRRFFSGYTLYRAQNYLEMILIASAGERALCRVVCLSKSDVPQVQKEEPESMALPQENDEDMTYYEAKTLVAQRLNFEYPFLRLSKLPSKLSVSRLSPHVLDDGEREGVQEDVMPPVPLAMPRFLKKEPDKDVSATERGTAMHVFMQFCDFEAACRNGVASEVERLAKARFLFDSDKDKMDLAKLKAFFDGELAAQIMRSDRVYREKRFMIRYPATLFSESEDPLLTDETVLVQGVIDCAFFDQDGKLILVDYKTDAFREGTDHAYIRKTLRERHSRQLGYYQMACESLFGCAPAHTYVYSFALDGTVEIEPYGASST